MAVQDPLGLSGLVVVDKPAGLTSHDVVARLRRILRTRKVGHAGTLDPMATGRPRLRGRARHQAARAPGPGHQGLHRHDPARRRDDHGRRRGRGRHHGRSVRGRRRRRRRRDRRADGPDPAGAQLGQRDQGRRAAGLRAGAGGGGGGAAPAARHGGGVHAARPARRRPRRRRGVLVRHLRAGSGPRPRCGAGGRRAPHRVAAHPGRTVPPRARPHAARAGGGARPVPASGRRRGRRVRPASTSTPPRPPTSPTAARCPPPGCPGRTASSPRTAGSSPSWPSVTAPPGRWWCWRRRPAEAPPALRGPPRSVGSRTWSGGVGSAGCRPDGDAASSPSGCSTGCTAATSS